MATPSVLDRIVQRGKLNCLVNSGSTFFAFRLPGETNLHRGLAADHCLAIAAFIFATPNPANYTHFISKRECDGQPIDELAGLETACWDIVAEPKTATVGREMRYGIEWPHTWFLDGGGMIFRKGLNITDDFDSANRSGLKYCVFLDSTTYDTARILFPKATAVFSLNNMQSRDLEAGRCDFALSDRATLAEQRLGLSNPDFFQVAANVFSREPLFGVTKRGGMFSKIVKWVSIGLKLASQLGVTQQLARDAGVYDFSRLGEEGFLLATSNFGACATCGTMLDVIGAVGNYYEIYDKYIEEHLPVANSLNDLTVRGGAITPLHWTPDVHVGAMPVPEPVPLIDRLRAIRQRGEINCGFDPSLVPGFASYDVDGEFAGVEVELCTAFAVAAIGGSALSTAEARAAANRKLINVVLVSPADKFEAVRAGTIDVMFGLTRCTIAADMTQKVSTSSPYLFSPYAVLVRDPERANADAHLLETTFCSTKKAAVFADRSFPIATPRTVVIDDYRNAADILERENCDVYIDLLHVLVAMQKDTASSLSQWTLSSQLLLTVSMCTVSPQEDWHWSQVQRWVFQTLMIADLLDLDLEQPVTERSLEGNRLLGIDPGFGSFSSGLFINAQFLRQILETVGSVKSFTNRWFAGLTNTTGFMTNQLYTTDGGTRFPAPWRTSAPIEKIESFECNFCPEGADCRAPGTTISDVLPIRGYWPEIGQSNSRFIRCLNDACLYDQQFINETLIARLADRAVLLDAPTKRIIPASTIDSRPVLLTECTDGYQGNLCTECASSFGRIGKFECVKCASSTATTFIVLAVIFVFAALSTALGYYTYSTAMNENKAFGYVVKCVFGCVQMLGLVLVVDADWGLAFSAATGSSSANVLDTAAVGPRGEDTFLTESLRIMGEVGLTSYLAAGCMISEGSSLKAVFAQLIILAAIPLSLLLLIPVFLHLYGLCRKIESREVMKRFKPAFFWGLFFLYPVITINIVRGVDCTRLGVAGETFFLSQDMSVQCWSTYHKKWLLALYMPLFFIFVSGVPFGCR
jgi:general L-amino acid transport system substrate-binding protein